MLPRRLLPATTAALASALLLAGCSGDAAPMSSDTASASAPSASPSASAIPCAPSGAASQAVEVSGSGKPTVSFPTPTSVTSTQRTVLQQGTGPAAKSGDAVLIDYEIFDGRTGKKIAEANYKGESRLAIQVGSGLQGLSESLACTKVGERFASVIPASSGFGDQGQEQLGIAGGDSLVLVAERLPLRATGTATTLPSGFPKITLAADGDPSVAIPSTDPPTTLKIARTKTGDGETVRSGDQVTVQYRGVLWRNGKTFDASWDRGVPASFVTTGVVPGFSKALVGQKVGSQVVAIIPPSQGYGKDGKGDIKGTDTMVFVIDVLATAHAAG